MNMQELLEKNMVKKQAVDTNEIAGSIASAKRFIDEAEKVISISVFDLAFTAAYSSMFHSARALLFSAGYKERSHFGLIVALKEIYKNNKRIQEYLAVLDKYRLTRHAIQYSGELSNELDALAIIKDAKAWLTIVSKELKVR